MKKYQCAAGTVCAALSSSFDTQHFRKVSNFNAQRFHQASMRSTLIKFRCTYATHNALQHSYATHNALQHYHSLVVSAALACPAHNLCLASAACKTCNYDHILCFYFCLTNYGFSSAPKKRHVYGSHLRKISVLSINIHVLLGGGGFRRNDACSFFRKYR